MSYPYLIFTDLSADIAPSLAEQYDIRFIPMEYLVGNEERVCSCLESEEALKRYYDAQRNGDETRTTQITPQKYMDVFTPLAREGCSVLYLSLSGGLSSTYQSSLLAAQDVMAQYPDVTITCVDSLSASGGIGLLLEAAAQNREDGMTIEENAAWLEENRQRVLHWFMVEDLMYLKRGGRISPATAVIGSALNIKPMLKIEPDGTLVNFTKKRGTKAALKQLIDLYATNSVGGKGERVYVMHSDNKPNAEYLVQAIQDINPESSVTTMMLSPIIGAHTGPGFCAICHFGKPECKRS